MSEIESPNWWAKSSRQIGEQNRVAKLISEIESRSWLGKSGRNIDKRNWVAKLVSRIEGETDERNRASRKLDERNRVAKLMSQIDGQNRVARSVNEIESRDWWTRGAKLCREMDERNWVRNGWAKLSREMDERNRVAKWMSEIKLRNWRAKSSREMDERNRVAKLISEIESREWWVVDSNARVRSPSPIRQRTTVWVTAVGGGVEATFFDGGWPTRAHDDGVSVARRWYRGVGGWVSLNKKKLINTVEC